jgi:hypothetical protein
MFRLPNAPSPQAETHELADFVEWQAWRDGSASLRNTNAVVDRLNDNFNNLGCWDDSDQSADQLDEVFLELERRSVACNGGYPFDLQMNGTVLSHLAAMDGASATTYRFLLLATRLNMKNERVHSAMDGTALMEELGACIMRNYLGHERAESFVFGTSAEGGFPKHVDDLCRVLGEGGGYSPADPGRVRAMDAKIDAVSWIPFTDRNPGKLIVFTQCKTGTNWRGYLGDLQPEAFMQTWTRDRVLNLRPLRAFCVSEALDRSRWIETSAQGGLFLDRCRLVDFANPLDSALCERMKRWTNAAFMYVTQ